VAIRCKIARLLLITNKKLHAGFQITCKSSALDDHEGQCALLWLNGTVGPTLATAGLLTCV